MLNSTKPIPIIVDDDGSQDGMAALALILANPNFSVEAITIGQGIGYPEVFVNGLARILERLGVSDIPVGVGRSDPLAGNNTAPDFIRERSLNYWSPYVTLPETERSLQTQNAAELIVETVKQSPEPVVILAVGPLTNIAQALRLDPSIIDNIAVVQIMGGAVSVPGNINVVPYPPYSNNTVSEFNIWADPVAAQEVFAQGDRGLKIQLSPLDGVNQITFDRDVLEAWQATGTPQSLLTSEFLNFALSEINVTGDILNPIWDMVAAFELSAPDLSPKTPLNIKVDTKSSPWTTQGQTIAVPGEPPNALVSLNPSFDNVPFTASDIFAYLAAQASIPGYRAGTPGDDVLYSTRAVKTISGLSGNDLIYGNGDKATLLGGSGNDQIYGSWGNEFILGDVGNDTIYGGGGLDTLLGGSGNDLIFGGIQADRILGGAGNDIIYSNGGDDFIESGTGLDTIWLSGDTTIIVLQASEGYDTINNFRLGATQLKVDSLDNLHFTNSRNGAQVFQGDNLLAVISWNSASTISSNANEIFVT